MKRNDDMLRKLAQEERARVEVPDHVRSAVEETLASLPETPASNVVEMPKRTRHWKIPATIAAAFLAIFLILPNTGAPVAQALSSIPVLGTVFEAVTFREYAEETETTDVSVKTPKIASEEKGKEAAEAVSAEIDAMNEKAVAQFRKDHADGGYGSLDIYYDVAADTDRWYTVRVVREETAASGAVEEDYYTFDKQTGNLVILSDLFEKDEYIAHISENIKKQMRAQMKKDDSVSYFHAGGGLRRDRPEPGLLHRRRRQPRRLLRRIRSRPRLDGHRNLHHPTERLSERFESRIQIILVFGLLDRFRRKGVDQ